MASGMLVASGKLNTYSIFRTGDTTYYTLGRTHAEEGVMVEIASNYPAIADAQAAAETDCEQIVTTTTTTP